MTNRKLALLMAAAAGGAMLVMAAISMATGVTQEAHEHFNAPEPYAIALVEHGSTLRLMFAIDIAFTILYTGFFAAFAAFLLELKRPALLVKIALGALLLTALLDIIEDHHIVVLLDEAEHRVLPSAGAIAFQAVESLTKFSVSFLGLVMFGLAIPRDTKLGLALALFLTVGTLVSAVIGYAASPEDAARMDSGRWIGFVAGFALAIAWLRAQPEPAT
jgi:hypothetical protein